MNARPALSVVAPCFNEAESLPAFVERMVAAAEAAVGPDHEIILVNDGSRDESWACIVAMSLRYRGVLGADLSRNYGQQMAVAAGLSLARGEQVLLIDADLQDPPELLPRMRALMAEGYDVVYGRRRSRAQESRFKLASASLFYRLLSRLSEVDIPVDAGDFRLMSRRIVERLNAMPEHDRYLRGMVAWLGGRQTEILYDRDPRHAGETHYTLAKMTRLAVNGLIGFSTVPLNFAVVLALIGAGIGLGILAYTLFSYFYGSVERGWTSLAMILVFFGVGQFGCLAILGLYLGRTYMEVKQRPLFLIDRLTGGVDAAVTRLESGAARANDKA